ncbi:hypothetical protein [Candidatus Accumulibacter contiguus]|uniref:hypothetical protein n=1 Tax=Candidatus Accumulibacter contiguus TaxID=2954381 RepID=UPI00207BCC86|nr:hypothetical protein [Candidatus Accumulibacter contiguus]
MSQIHPETLAAHGGSGVAEPYRDIVQPIHLATTFERAADGSYPGGRHLLARPEPGLRRR